MLQERGFHRWNIIHACLMLGGAAGLLILRQPWILGASALLSFLLLSWLGRANLNSLQPFGGYANQVTALRLVLLLWLSVSFWELPSLAIFAFIVLTLLLDGLDGYLARRYRHHSTFGLYFDIEVDAFTGALLAGIHYAEGTAGSWIVFIGSLRYFYILGIAAFGLWERSARSVQFARIIGMVFLCGFLGPFIVPLWLAHPALIISSLLASFSFGYSFHSLLAPQKK